MIDELMNLRCVKWILHVKELGPTVPISTARWRKRLYIKDFCKHTRVKLGQYFRYGNRVLSEFERNTKRELCNIHSASIPSDATPRDD